MPDFHQKASEVIHSLLNDHDHVICVEDCTIFDNVANELLANNDQQSSAVLMRSLASLLSDSVGKFIDDQLYVQIQAIAHNLGEHLGDLYDAKACGSAALVTPAAPTISHDRIVIALYVHDESLLGTLRNTFVEAGLETIRLGRIEELENYLGVDFPAVIIADQLILQNILPAITLFNNLRETMSVPPHLFMIGGGGDVSARLEAVRLGVTRYIASPPDIHRLLSVIRGVTAITPAKPYRVLIVDDDPVLGGVHELSLRKCGIETLLVSDPVAAPHIVASFQPDVIVSDIFMSGCNGLELLAVLRQDDALADTPVVLLTSDDSSQRRIEALTLGADDYLVKPIVLPLFVATITAHAKRSRRLKRNRMEAHGIVSKMIAATSLASSATVKDAVRYQDGLLPLQMIPSEDYVVTEEVITPLSLDDIHP